MRRVKAWLFEYLWALLLGMFGVLGFFANWAWCANATIATHDEKLKGIDTMGETLKEHRSEFKEFLREYKLDMRRLEMRLRDARKDGNDG
jgi:hypothetical protein